MNFLDYLLKNELSGLLVENGYERKTCVSLSYSIK